MLRAVRTLLVAMLVLAACGREDRAELDRAEREDRPRGLTVRAERDDRPGGFNPLLNLGPPPMPVETPTAPPPPKLGVAAQLFVDLMVESTPREFCRDGMYFRECFSVTERECRARVAATLPGCVRHHAADIPEHPDADSGRRAGEKLGACAGTRYEIALAAEGRRSTRAECDEIDRWR